MNRDWSNFGKETKDIFCRFISTSDGSSFYLTKIGRYIFIFKLQPQNARLQKIQVLTPCSRCLFIIPQQRYSYLQSCAAKERITGRSETQVRPSCCQKAAAGVQRSQMKIASLWKVERIFTASGKNCRGPSTSS